MNAKEARSITENSFDKGMEMLYSRIKEAADVGRCRVSVPKVTLSDKMIEELENQGYTVGRHLGEEVVSSKMVEITW